MPASGSVRVWTFHHDLAASGSMPVRSRLPELCIAVTPQRRGRVSVALCSTNFSSVSAALSKRCAPMFICVMPRKPVPSAADPTMSVRRGVAGCRDAQRPGAHDGTATVHGVWTGGELTSAGTCSLIGYPPDSDLAATCPELPQQRGFRRRPRVVRCLTDHLDPDGPAGSDREFPAAVAPTFARRA